MTNIEDCLWKIVTEMIDEEDALDINSGFQKCYHCEDYNKTCYYPLSKYLNFELINKIKKK